MVNGNGGVMFHHFRDGDLHPSIPGSLDAEELDRLLTRIGREKILRAHDWLDRFARGNRGAEVCLTFDDTLRSQLDVAVPVLESHGLTGMFFVYTSPIEGVIERLELYRYFRSVHYESVSDFYDSFYLALRDRPEWTAVASALASFDPVTFRPQFDFYSDEDRCFRFVRDDVLGEAVYSEVVDAMLESSGFLGREDIIRHIWMDAPGLRNLHERGHVIGLHSHTHPLKMERLPAETQREEYERNAEMIASIIGARPTVMAHPSGSYGKTTLDILRDLGVTVGFGVAEPVRWDPALEIARVDHTMVE